MTEHVKETIYRVAEDVLEKLAFLFSFREDERDHMDYATAMAASVSFGGEFEGSLIMAVSEDVLPELAANMLGIEEQTTPAEQQDALKELINVVCGNLLPEIAGKKNLFNVNPPTIIPRDDAILAESGPRPVAMAKLALEEGQCDIILFVQDGVSLEDLSSESR